MKTKQQLKDEAYKKYLEVQELAWKKYDMPDKKCEVCGRRWKKYEKVQESAEKKYLEEIERINKMKDNKWEVCGK
jgi:hypothetical protein